MDERPNSIPWPPLLLGGAIVVGLALQSLAPVAWPRGAAANWLTAAGVALIVAAFAVDLWAAAVLSRHKTTIMPHRASKALVTEGPFRLSRNPVYLGNLAVVAGLGLVLGNAWMPLLVPLLAALLDRLAIRREERFLESKFPTAWRAYSVRVARWLWRI